MGLVTCRADGRRRLYRLEPARLRPFREWLAAYEQAWNARMDRVGDYLKELQRQGDGEEVKTRSIDLRVDGDYHFVFVTDDGREMSFHGTFLEVEPTRTVETLIFDGWPGVEAVKTVELRQAAL